MYIDPNKLDPSGLTQVKSFGGCTTSGLARKVDQFPRSREVKKVIAHIGINDQSVVTPMTRTSVALLVKGIQMKFPNADITLSAALPTKEGMTKGISDFNEVCSEVCYNKMVNHVDFGTSFLNRKELYSKTENDFVHLGDEGTTLLTSLFRQCLKLDGPTTHTTTQPTDAKNGSSQMKESNKSADSTEKEKTPENKGSKIETRVTRKRETPDEANMMVHTEPVECTGGNVFQAFAGPCHSLVDARHFKCKVAEKFPHTSGSNNVMTAYCFTQSDGTLKWKCEEDGEKGAGPRMKFLMERINMKNCIVVVTRNYAGKMFKDRWSAIQSQLSVVAAKAIMSLATWTYTLI